MKGHDVLNGTGTVCQQATKNTWRDYTVTDTITPTNALTFTLSVIVTMTFVSFLLIILISQSFEFIIYF